MMTSLKKSATGTRMKPRTRRAGARDRQGFTLVEICVVFAVAFVLLASLWLVYRGVTKAGRSTEDTALAVARAQLAMERIRTDLLSAGAGTVERGEDASSLKISKGDEVLVSYEQGASSGLVRTAAEKSSPGPEETEAAFGPVEGKPQAVALTVTSTSHSRSVVLRYEHPSETGARRSQHPEWNRLEPSSASAE